MSRDGRIGGAGLTRRGFVAGAAALPLLWWSGSRAGRAAEGPAAPELSPALREALHESPFVYVSPLLRKGSESTCHGEVWFGWIDGAVVLTTGTDTWKTRALRRGLDRARIWVGDHGRWKRLLGTNEDFRRAPSFVARAERTNDPELLDRLMAAYREKYPDEITTWEERMRRGHAEGERVMIRYRPLSGGDRARLAGYVRELRVPRT